MDKTDYIRLEQKIDAIAKAQNETNVHMAVYNEQLKIHIEGVVQTRTLISKLDEKVEPVVSFYNLTVTVFKIIKWVAGITGIGTAVNYLLSYLKII